MGRNVPIGAEKDFWVIERDEDHIEQPLPGFRSPFSTGNHRHQPIRRSPPNLGLYGANLRVTIR